MTLPSGFIPGWISDPHYVQDQILMRAGRGDAVMVSTFSAQYHDDLPGTWERMKARGIKGIFLRDKELIVNNGKYRRPFLQRAGTCVSRGTAKGCQVSLDVATSSNQLLRSITVSFAPVYSIARIEVGKNRCGFGDGAILSDAMTAIHDYGVATAELFPGTSEDDVERLAVKYAAPGSRTPSSWIQACQSHVCKTFCVDQLSLLFDCIAAGYAVPYAMNYVTGQPNANGISDLGSFGPHCRCFVGVYVDEHGETQLESAESWGRFPAGNPENDDQTMPVEKIPRITLRYAGGEKQLAPGDVGVNAKRFWNEIQQNGECWGVSAPIFQSANLADFVRAN